MDLFVQLYPVSFQDVKTMCFYNQLENNKLNPYCGGPG